LAHLFGGVQRGERFAQTDHPAVVPAQPGPAFGRIESQGPLLQTVPVHQLPRHGACLLHLHRLRPFLPVTLTPGWDITANAALRQPTCTLLTCSVLSCRYVCL